MHDWALRQSPRRQQRHYIFFGLQIVAPAKSGVIDSLLHVNDYQGRIFIYLFHDLRYLMTTVL